VPRIAGSLPCCVTLSCSRLHVEASQLEAADLALAHGFDAVEPHVSFLMSLTDAGAEAVARAIAGRSLLFGPANLPFSLSGPEPEFRAGLQRLPEVAARTAALGVPGFIRWLMPHSNELTYRRHFDLVTERVCRCADVLAAHGQRLGLEYLGPKTAWAGGRFTFVHTLVELAELIEATGASNIGFQLDSFHWHTAGEGAEDLLRAAKIGIVLLELNDAVPGRPEQVDRERRLPRPDGEIDMGTFIRTVFGTGYAGPVHAEPHDASLRGRPRDQVVASTAAALTSTLALARSPTPGTPNR
jgi:sugar phosphate isomerase/epimerase